MPNLEKSLSWCLYFCRVAVCIVFGVWTYDKFARPEHGVQTLESFYWIPGVPEVAVSAFAFLQLVMLILLLTGLFKPLIRGYFLFLSLLTVLAPGALLGYISAFSQQPHPTILFYTNFCVLACAFAIYYLRDYDTKLSLKGNNHTEADAASSKSLTLDIRASLALCRFGVFLVFFVWTLAKFTHPEHGVNIMRGHYMVEGVAELAISLFGLFGLFELGLVVAMLLGYWKRIGRGFFLLISIYSVMTPRVLGGYEIFFSRQSEPQIFLFPGFAMLACAIAIYWLREYDTWLSWADRVHSSKV
ncbi:MAG: hypothetical protein HOL48_09830 [Porticoccaceae bacterium]|nr:hypothetical protein [Porticoccaceae bacterium]